jgi:hypothetical protein
MAESLAAPDSAPMTADQFVKFTIGAQFVEIAVLQEEQKLLKDTILARDAKIIELQAVIERMAVAADSAVGDVR